MPHKTYIEINTNNLKYNVRELIKNYPDYRYYIGVVKGNIYGHGIQIVKHLIESGINYLAVSTLEEAIKIREEFKKDNKENLEIPILCLLPIHLEDISDAIKNNITITISNYDYFKKFIESNIYKELNKNNESNNQELKVHLKINSGMNRLGISDKNEVLGIFNFFKDIENSKNIRLEGIYSHFATTGINDKYWDNQLENFKEITSLIDLKQIPIIHFGRSLTLINHKKIDFCNGIRIGIAMYGYYKNPQNENSLLGFLRKIKNKINRKVLNISETSTKIPFELKPAFNVLSEIIEIRKIKKGDSLGYGYCFKADEDCFIGFMPVGYADGLSKKNKNGFVSINNKKYKIISVDMGITIVLIDETVKVYDKVEIIGKNISIFEFAKRNEITVYEALCIFKESVPRILV